MSYRGTPILLDTNILVHILRGQAAGKWLIDTYRLRRSGERPRVCDVSLGELLALAKKWNWKPERRAEVFELSQSFLRIGISNLTIMEEYARLSTHWERLGKRMEQNDLWIAATAKVSESTLLTTDEDFIKLSETLDVEWVDPAHLKKISK